MTNEPSDDVRAAIVAAGVLPRDVALSASHDELVEQLRDTFGPSCWWRSGEHAPNGDGAAVLGQPLPAWSHPPDRPLRVDELSSAVYASLPTDHDSPQALRVRVESSADLEELEMLGTLGSAVIAPSFASRGSLTRPLVWQWPLRVTIVESAATGAWLDAVTASPHHGIVYETTVWSPHTACELAIVHVDDLHGVADPIDAFDSAAGVVVVGDAPGTDLMDVADDLVRCPIAIGVAAPPDRWWVPFFEAMAHDRPIDVAVAAVRETTGVDMVIAGPAIGLDLTAPGRWFVTVAPTVPAMAVALDDVAGWNWSSEGQGSTNVRALVDRARADGVDPEVRITGTGQMLGGPVGHPGTITVGPTPTGAEPPEEMSGAAPDGLDEEMAEALPGEPDEELAEAASDEPDEELAGADPSPAEADDDHQPVAPEQRRRGRFVHAVVAADDGDRLTLVADQVNRLRCWIGPDRGEFAASSTTATPELPRTVELHVDLLVGRDVVANSTMTLPVGATARSSDCELDVPALAAGVFAAELAFTVDGRMFELVSLTGIVLPAGTDGTQMPPLKIESLVQHRDLIELSDRSTSTTSLDVTVADGGLVVREFGARAAGVYDLTSTRPLIATLMEQLYGTEKSLVRKGVHGFAGGDPDVEWTDILRTMATHGWLLHRSLLEQGFTDPGARFEVVNRLPDAYVPIELVYDRGAPAPDAGIDAACLAALARGDDDCGHCHPFAELTDDERDQNPRLCPYGFWSLGKVIERHDPDPDGLVAGPASTDALRSLHRLDSVLAGWSQNLRDEDRTALPAALGAGGRRTVLVADDWDSWRDELAQSPSLLLALPHHDDSDGIGSLEIGGEALGLQRALDLFVRTPAGEPGPVLILLGCETDIGSALGHPSFARAFAASTSVVIGTLSKVLGRHAVPFAERLVDALEAAQDTGGDVGTVLRNVRRTMFADGYLMALGVIALGDADWRLARAPADDRPAAGTPSDDTKGDEP